MPSRADSSTASAREASRIRLELGLRLGAFAALIGALLLVSGLFGRNGVGTGASLIVRTDSSRQDSAGSRVLQSISASLRNAGSSAGVLQPVHLVANRIPDNATRALLSAAGVAGVPVTWTDSTRGGAVAVEVQPLIDPRGGYAVRVAARDSVPVALQDSLGLIDSVRTVGGGATILVGKIAGALRAASGAGTASAVAPPSPEIRRALVFGSPGWESKFTVAALEERGWKVDVRYAIGKNVTVTQGDPVAPDTARYAIVIALDSSVQPQIGSIRRYVTSGGGLIIAGTATTLREWTTLLPARAGERQPGVPGGLETEEPLSGITWRPLTPDSNASVIARNPRTTGASVASVVARTYGAGRVVASGYDGIWEWRMAGPDGSVDAHRTWWSGLVSAAACTPAMGAPSAALRDAPGDAAPFADMRASLGEPGAVPAMAASAGGRLNWELMLAAAACGLLVVEWASRRLRGAK